MIYSKYSVQFVTKLGLCFIIFKKKVGINLNEYINNYRIMKACELLGDFSIKIMDAGLKIEFSNANTFNRVFKKRMGITPAEYRKKEYRADSLQIYGQIFFRGI